MLTKVKYSGKYGHMLNEITKPQRQILKGLKIELPSNTQLHFFREMRLISHLPGLIFSCVHLIVFESA